MRNNIKTETFRTNANTLSREELLCERWARRLEIAKDIYEKFNSTTRFKSSDFDDFIADILEDVDVYINNIVSAKNYGDFNVAGFKKFIIDYLNVTLPLVYGTALSTDVSKIIKRFVNDEIKRPFMNTIGENNK